MESICASRAKLSFTTLDLKEFSIFSFPSCGSRSLERPTLGLFAVLIATAIAVLGILSYEPKMILNYGSLHLIAASIASLRFILIRKKHINAEQENAYFR